MKARAHFPELDQLREIDSLIVEFRRSPRAHCIQIPLTRALHHAADKRLRRLGAIELINRLLITAWPQRTSVGPARAADGGDAFAQKWSIVRIDEPPMTGARLSDAHEAGLAPQGAWLEIRDAGESRDTR